MMEQIKTFLFVLSIIFTMRFIVEFILKLVQENPTPMSLSKVNESLLYVAVSYIITYFLI
jgi:hypothetical protein